MKNEASKFPFSMYRESGEGRLVNSRSHSDKMEIVELLSGEADIQIGTEMLHAVAGDFLFVPPSLVFRIDASTEKASVRGMIFDRSIIEDNMENYETEIFYMFYLQAQNKLAVFRSDHPVYGTFAKYMRESYDEYISKDVCHKLPIRANIYLMITALLRYYCGSKDESDKIIYHNVLRLRPVIEYIAEHYSEKIYIEKLSDMVNVSPDYFTKMFKDSIGRTPIDYINCLRVNSAMQKLTETDETMAEISESLGFSNPNYFHKIFKQYMQTSPLSYRKSTR